MRISLAAKQSLDKEDKELLSLTPRVAGRFLVRALGLMLLSGGALFAQTAATANATETAIKSAQSAGDNAWMLVSSALVLMMTGPGLALFYGGLVRRKNVLATMMQSFILMALVSMLWVVFGYSLAFAEGTPFVGGFQYLGLNGVGAAPNADYAATIPQQTYMLLPVDVRDHHSRADLAARSPSG